MSDIVRFDPQTGLPLMDSDFVRVVRCKDCKHYGEMLPNADNRMICHKFALNFDNDFFCKNGERRTDETD